MAMYKNIVDNTHALNQRMVDLAQGACNCFQCLDEFSVPLNRTNVGCSPLVKNEQARTYAEENALMLGLYKKYSDC